MKRIIALVLCLALPAAAQDAVVVDGGVLLPDSKAIEVAKRIAVCEAERDSLKASMPSVAPLVVAIVAGVLLTGAGVGVGYALGAASK